LVTVVDDADYGVVSRYKWKVLVGSRTRYAARTVRKNRKYQTVYLHRYLTGASADEQVDHRDGDGLNNQRANLRRCSATENRRNQGKYRGSSRFKGVSWRPDRNKWRATLVVAKRQVSLGYFKSEEGAALAYNRAAIEAFGEFARRNDLECPAVDGPAHGRAARARRAGAVRAIHELERTAGPDRQPAVRSAALAVGAAEDAVRALR
jgi:AP2 domain